MTGIIFRGLEDNSFGIVRFYVARANRIIPALACLCVVLLVFGWFCLMPAEYSLLAKHAASSVTFISNFMYWQEAGYFDAASHEKWLLHTWSLSVEWQFYLLYPLLLLALKPFFSFDNLKRLVVVGTVIGFAYSAYASVKWPNPSYYLLPTRSWELMFGGVAYLYPWALKPRPQNLLNVTGLLCIACSYFFITNATPWPGYAAILPVLGAYLVIVANQQQSWLTNNRAFQALGKWSYSIYLWHWPVVVVGYRYDISHWWIYGLPLSVLLGVISYRYVESMKWPSLKYTRDIIKVKPAWMMVVVTLGGLMIVNSRGVSSRFDEQILAMLDSASFSPYREQCHIDDYQPPHKSCEYFGDDISWAVFGDSHTVELAYALAEKLKPSNQGVKHYSFSGCAPSLLQKENSGRCTKWYKEALEDIVADTRIKNVVVNHRYAYSFFGNQLKEPSTLTEKEQNKVVRVEKSLDAVIKELAAAKDNVYVLYPFPEIKRPVVALISNEYLQHSKFEQVLGSSVQDYNEQNRIIIEHFNNSKYPANVKLIKPQDAYCDDQQCLAVKAGKALYFDDNHPSVYGAEQVVELLPLHNAQPATSGTQATTK